MDSHALAKELLALMFSLNKSRPQRRINESMRGENFVMHYIIFHDGPVQPSEISNFMNISTARAAAALNNLERKGLITRRIDLNDRRRILVELTEQGRDFAKNQQEQMQSHATELLDRLGEPDATEAIRILKRVTEIMVDLHAHHTC